MSDNPECHSEPPQKALILHPPFNCLSIPSQQLERRFSRAYSDEYPWFLGLEKCWRLATLLAVPLQLNFLPRNHPLALVVNRFCSRNSHILFFSPLKKSWTQLCFVSVHIYNCSCFFRSKLCPHAWWFWHYRTANKQSCSQGLQPKWRENLKAEQEIFNQLSSWFSIQFEQVFHVHFMHLLVKQEAEVCDPLQWGSTKNHTDINLNSGIIFW